MKIRALDLAAFGPFTGRKLEFSSDHGLHIVYGANEAGKSSALRGLKAMLYGIEHRTLDNFLHGNKELRVGGRLTMGDGREIGFLRRKGRKNTLLDLATGVALDDALLTPFLQQVGEELFATLFGIDHEALVRGGREILAQQGEVGQMLFSAALGSQALHTLLGTLDAEADALFRPHGSKQRINAALRRYHEQSRAIREHSLSSAEWQTQHDALAGIAAQLDQVQARLADHQKELNHLQRLRRLLPKFARLRDARGKLEALGEVVPLASDFGDRRRAVIAELAKANAVLDKARPRLDSARLRLDALIINQALLDEAETIDDLHAGVGSHRKAMKERPGVDAECRRRRAEAQALLDATRPDLGLDDVDQLRAVLARRQAVIALGAKQAVLDSRLEQARDDRRDIGLRLQAAIDEQTGLDAPGSTAALRRAILAARRPGDIDAHIASRRQELEGLRAQCLNELSRLGLDAALLDGLPGLLLPGHEAIARYEQDYERLEQRTRELQDRRDGLADELAVVKRGLDELQRLGKVPTEAELVAVRAGRDRGWQALRRRWLVGEVSADAATKPEPALHPDPEPVPEPEGESDQELADDFEQRVVAADELSDRLRLDAKRVHELARLQALRQDLEERIVQVTADLEGQQDDRRRVDVDWQALWAGSPVTPRSPAEMRAWLVELDRLREYVESLAGQRRGLATLERERDSHLDELGRQLQALTPGQAVKFDRLEPLLAQAEQVADDQDGQRRQCQTLAREIASLEQLQTGADAKCSQAQEALDAWQQRWRESLQGCGLPPQTPVSAVSGFFDTLNELFARLADVENLGRRLQLIETEASLFRDQVQALVARIAPDLDQLSPDVAVTRLNTQLVDNRRTAEERRQTERQIAATGAEIASAEVDVRAMTQRLQALSVEAECANDEASLEQAEHNSTQYLEWQAAITRLEAEILETGEGAGIDALALQVDAIDADELPGRIERLSQTITLELDPRKMDLLQAKGSKQKELDLMDGGDDAARLADDAQATLATMRADAEQYLRVRLAARILRNQIEAYRQHNQGPLLQRASEHFATLTIGSFAGLATDYNDKDEAILVGVRPDEHHVHVDGMSSGTRDQLYLALRLASLEKYMETHEPMPFIVDDVLVDFDDQRSEAALQALADLADRTQVVLFTHHSQVITQAQGLREAVQIHRL